MATGFGANGPRLRAGVTRGPSKCHGQGLSPIGDNPLIYFSQHSRQDQLFYRLSN